ncbi:hypothetical protein BC962_1654 [Gillisia mitskevichiae]|uniref:Uncharacterized protein n=1 Tax=Gillisia mitskevichiae TaxID=270921 RepID=A0A495PRY5_9FLAO|nr:hypothetical protein BC962_1654 [Gillisia mitskevichiae]
MKADIEEASIYYILSSILISKIIHSVNFNKNLFAFLVQPYYLNFLKY